MEVVTGAAASIINEETYKRISKGNQVKNRPQLETAKVKLRTYTGELVKVIGTLNVIVKYEKRSGTANTRSGRMWTQLTGKGLVESSNTQLERVVQNAS